MYYRYKFGLCVGCVSMCLEQDGQKAGAMMCVVMVDAVWGD